MKTILGIVAGYIIWSILWVGIDGILRAVWTSYDQSVAAMTFSSWQLFVPLVLSVFCSIAAGFVAASIAKKNLIAPLILGILLLLTGIFVQMSVWEKIPLWYHLAFWILLVPMTIWGGKLTQPRYREVRRNY